MNTSPPVPAATAVGSHHHLKRLLFFEQVAQYHARAALNCEEHQAALALQYEELRTSKRKLNDVQLETAQVRRDVALLSRSLRSTAMRSVSARKKAQGVVQVQALAKAWPAGVNTVRLAGAAPVAAAPASCDLSKAEAANSAPSVGAPPQIAAIQTSAAPSASAPSTSTPSASAVSSSASSVLAPPSKATQSAKVQQQSKWHKELMLKYTASTRSAPKGAAEHGSTSSRKSEVEESEMQKYERLLAKYKHRIGDLATKPAAATTAEAMVAPCTAAPASAAAAVVTQ